MTDNKDEQVDNEKKLFEKLSKYDGTIMDCRGATQWRHFPIWIMQELPQFSRPLANIIASYFGEMDLSQYLGPMAWRVSKSGCYFCDDPGNQYALFYVDVEWDESDSRLLCNRCWPLGSDKEQASNFILWHDRRNKRTSGKGPRDVCSKERTIKINPHMPYAYYWFEVRCSD